MMSCMLKAIVPRPTAVMKRSVRPWLAKRAQVSLKRGAATLLRGLGRLRGSCFQAAVRFSTTVNTAAPWMTWISCVGVKLVSSTPKTAPKPIRPTNCIVYISATTRGRTRSGAKSAASARPAVCTICMPAPTIRKARAALALPIQTGPSWSPPSSSKAKGMIARPPNCSPVPIQM